MKSPPNIPEAVRARILIVDGSSPVRCVLAEILARHGYGVDLAGSAREALLLAQTGQWDAVVIDSGLPDMSGVELYTRLRHDSGRECLPVIFVSGYSERQLLEALQSMPRSALLAKPFSVVRFLVILEQCLASKAGTP